MGNYGEPVNKWKPTDQDLEEISSMASIGCNEKIISDKFGITNRTFNNHPEAVYAYHLGNAVALAKLVEPNFRKAMNGEDSSLAMFFMKTLGHYREITTYKVNDFVGTTFDKMNSIDDKMKHGEITAKDYKAIVDALTKRYIVEEQDERLNKIEEKLKIGRYTNEDG